MPRPPPPPCATIGTVLSAAVHNATTPKRAAHLRIIIIFIGYSPVSMPAWFLRRTSLPLQTDNPPEEFELIRTNFTIGIRQTAATSRAPHEIAGWFPSMRLFLQGRPSYVSFPVQPDSNRDHHAPRRTPPPPSGRPSQRATGSPAADTPAATCAQAATPSPVRAPAHRSPVRSARSAPAPAPPRCPSRQNA